MMCQECGERPATFHLTRVINKKKTEVHLCERCARERGEFEFLLEPKFNIHSLLSGFLEQDLGHRAPAKTATQQCPACGLSYAQFARTGLLGCRDCYETFASVIEPVARRVHGANRHIGKAPPQERPRTADADGQRLEKLQGELQCAIEEERYEDAARLRDEIREFNEQEG